MLVWHDGDSLYCKIVKDEGKVLGIDCNTGNFREVKGIINVIFLVAE